MNHFLYCVLFAVFVFSGMACQKEQRTTQPQKILQTQADNKVVSTSRPVDRIKNPKSVVPPESWIQQRVKASNLRLNKTEAGRFIWRSIEAHGGLATWFRKGALAFRFTYTPVNQENVKDTYQTIELWSSKAHHVYLKDKKVTFGWSGKHAWKHPSDAKLPIPVRFWSLTPYYFVAVPFVFADSGVVLKKEPPLVFEGKTYTQIRVTFQPDAGDAPDDYYVVLIDPNTHKVRGVRYIVTFRGFFKKGKHSPEKLMSYDGQQVIDGLTFAKTFRTFQWDGKKPTQLVTRSSMTEVIFLPKLEATFFNIPKDAKLLGFKKK